MVVRLRTPNLIVNPDAESGGSATNYSTTVAPQGWTTTSNFTAVDYAAGGAGQLSPADSTAVDGEQSFFAGGPSNSGSTAFQRIDVSALAAGIDDRSIDPQHGAILYASGFMGGFGAEDDGLTMTVREISASGDTLFEGSVGPALPGERGNTTSLILHFFEMIVIQGTRFIDVILTSNNPTGGYNNGYADNLSVTLLDEDQDFGEYVEIDGNANPLIFTGEAMPAATGIMFVEQVFAGMTAIFAADQFGPGHLALNAQIVSSHKADTVLVQLAPDQTFSAAQFRFDDGRWQDGMDFVRLQGSTGAETMTGSIKSDVIDGAAGNDQLIGGGGNDQLNGGANIDTAQYAGNRADYTVTRVQGTVQVSGPDGTDTLNSVERVQFADATVTIAKAHNDFNDDGMSDVLFSNQGTVFRSDYEWQLNDRSLLDAGAIDLYDPAFTTQVIGDFDGDGKADALFQNPDTGGVWEWRLDGTGIVAQNAVDVADPTFTLLGTGDLNGDTKHDVLFRNAAGFVYEWQMDGFDNTPMPVGPLDPNWHLQGTGDFNGDGRDDILLHYKNAGNAADPANGAFVVWQMNGSAIENTLGIERPDSSWQTLGIGDFNGDGIADLAIRNASATPDNGAVWIYLLAGTVTSHGDGSKTLDILAQGAAGIADPSEFHLQQIGDFNGDGKDDILYRNNLGYFYSWDMDGTTIASESLLQDAAQWAPVDYVVVKPQWELV